jgi:hypothetical protein
MKQQLIDLFKSHEIQNLKSVHGGIWVFCKDAQGNNLGSFETDCTDSSYWLDDCKLNWENTIMAVSSGGG